MKKLGITLLLSLCVGTAFGFELPDKYQDPVHEFNYLYTFVQHNDENWAEYRLGQCYETGYGTKPDLVKAYANYRLAAINDYTVAVKALARIKVRMTAQQIAAGDKLYMELNKQVSQATLDAIKNM